jgi:hypothetical protein
VAGTHICPVVLISAVMSSIPPVHQAIPSTDSSPRSEQCQTQQSTQNIYLTHLLCRGTLSLLSSSKTSTSPFRTAPAQSWYSPPNTPNIPRPVFVKSKLTDCSSVRMVQVTTLLSFHRSLVLNQTKSQEESLHYSAF